MRRSGGSGVRPSPAPPPAAGGWGWGTWGAVAFGWWTLEGVASAANLYRMVAPAGVTWTDAYLTTLASAWLWVPLTVLALWLAGRLPLDRDAWRRRLPVYVAVTAAACAFRALAVVALNPWVGWYPQLPPFHEALVTSVLNNVFLFWMIVGFGHALAYARRDRERSEELARAELRSLKAQIHPHFLFNALQTASALTGPDGHAARGVLSDLGDLLRISLERTGVQEVSLQEELDFLDRYLAVEAVRFQDRLSVDVAVEEDARDALVPSLLLQPLVENAVKHGVAPSVDPVHVAVRVWRRGDRLVVRVSDDARRRRAGRVASNGVGLANLEARLRGLYGPAAALAPGPIDGGGYAAEVVIPVRKSGGSTSPHASD